MHTQVFAGQLKFADKPGFDLLLQPLWFKNALFYAGLTLFCLAAASLDDRTLYGVSVWSKPFKFSLSLVAYFGTLAWCATLLRGDTLNAGSGRVLLWVPVVMAAGEMAYITVMGALGLPSHFNVSTPFYAAMYSLMGFGAACMVLTLGWLGVLIGRQRGLSEPMLLAVVLGLILTLLLGGGFGGYLGGAGSHWVQATPSDANGFPLFNWSRDGGDLRVAHFFGMHVMQALPLFAWVLPKRLTVHVRLALVVAFACAYTAFTITTFYQAVTGQPFFV